MIWRSLARILNAPLAIVDRELEPRDAIVVLGAALGPGDTLTPVLAERVAAAAELFRSGAAPRIVTTGGITRSARRSEAAVLADALALAGIPRDAISVEDRAQTTLENAQHTASLLGPPPEGSAPHWPPADVREPRSQRRAPRPWRVWLVTQPFHAKRAEARFRAAGFEALAWHIADSRQYRDHRLAVRWLVREYAAWARVAVTRWPQRHRGTEP